MNYAWSLGPFILTQTTLLYVISTFVGVAVMLWRLYLDGEKVRVWLDIFATYLMIVVLCYKFGFLFDDPGILLRSPRVILFMSGGSTGGWVIGVFCMLAFTYRGMSRGLLSFRVLANILPYGFAVMGISAYALQWFWDPSLLSAVRLLLPLGLLIVLLLQRGTLREGNHLAIFLVGLGIGGMALSIVEPHLGGSLGKITTWIGLTKAQCSWVGIALIGMWLLHLKRRMKPDNPS
ncbi:hypothetical protein [Paenibacillus terrigena]|uniref:hypothetical protein n=1 Tax=Paenibacillus terrigena TaxID=369333 RepID=UPI00037ACF40|nr:hypothetical protein [Paenibacillus terrigena]